MFADLDETLRELLVRQVPLDVGEVDVSFEAPDRAWSGQLSRPTVNCFLYDVHENIELRRTEWDVQRRGNSAVTFRRMPTRIDATYQITVWARAPEDEHRLLWRVMAALFRNQTIEQDLLQGALRDQPFPLKAQVAQPNQSRANPAELWQALDNRVRPVLTYTVTLALDPEQVYTSPLVFTSVMGLRQKGTEEPDSLHYRIRGRVRAEDQGIPGATVCLEETGAEVTTSAKGEFAFRAREGALTLLVTLPDGQTATREIQVPSAEYDVVV
jgi:Pvc16 N-terminal domain/Carboxypeptidase regulatory-like domain